MNAFVQPVMARYLSRIGDGLKRAGCAAPLFVMKSNGGAMSATAAAIQPVQTILSARRAVSWREGRWPQHVARAISSPATWVARASTSPSFTKVGLPSLATLKWPVSH